MFERIWNIIALAIRAVQLTTEESEFKKQKRNLQRKEPFTSADKMTCAPVPVRVHELSRR